MSSPSTTNGNADSSSQFFMNLVSGGLTGIVAKTAVAPVDRVKILLQTQKLNKGLSVLYSGPINCITRVYAEQGILSFWRGNLANIYRYFPQIAMNFAFKDEYKALIMNAGRSRFGTEHNHLLVVMSNLIAGGAAGATALFFSHPFDVARTRLASDTGSNSANSTTATSSSSPSSSSNSSSSRQYKGTVDCLMRAWRSEGINGLYAGFPTSLGGVVVFKALFMGGYDIMKYACELENSSILHRAVAAQALTTIVGTLCYPIDTVKRRLMVQRSHLNKIPHSSISAALLDPGGSSKSINRSSDSGGSDISKPRVAYRNGLDCFLRIIREEGARTLFTGLSVNLVRGMSGPILLVGYDELKKLLES